MIQLKICLTLAVALLVQIIVQWGKDTLQYTINTRLHDPNLLMTPNTKRSLPNQPNILCQKGSESNIKCNIIMLHDCATTLLNNTFISSYLLHFYNYNISQNTLAKLLFGKPIQ